MGSTFPLHAAAIRRSGGRHPRGERSATFIWRTSWRRRRDSPPGSCSSSSWASALHAARGGRAESLAGRVRVRGRRQAPDVERRRPGSAAGDRRGRGPATADAARAAVPHRSRQHGDGARRSASSRRSSARWCTRSPRFSRSISCQRPRGSQRYRAVAAGRSVRSREHDRLRVAERRRVRARAAGGRRPARRSAGWDPPRRRDRLRSAPPSDFHAHARSTGGRSGIRIELEPPTPSTWSAVSWGRLSPDSGSFPSSGSASPLVTLAVPLLAAGILTAVRPCAGAARGSGRSSRSRSSPCRSRSSSRGCWSCPTSGSIPSMRESPTGPHRDRYRHLA